MMNATITYGPEHVVEPIGFCDCKAVHRCHWCEAVEIPTSSDLYGEPVCGRCAQADADLIRDYATAEGIAL